MSKKKNIPGSWSYCAFIDSTWLDALKIIIINFGSEITKKARTNPHKNNCAKCEYPLNYNIYYERYDRIFGNKIISKKYDSEFVRKVGEKLDPDAFLLSEAPRSFRNDFLEANLSETECIVIHYTGEKEECIKKAKAAIEEVNNEWYYTDESLRVDIKASNNETYDIDMKVRPFLINRKTRRFIASHINSYKQYDKVLVQGLTAADYIYTKFDNINRMVVYISSYDIYYNKAIYNEFKKLDNIEFKYYNSDKEIEDLYMNEKIDNFDVIITNPPYGKTGAIITDLINKKRKKDSEFINLLPANDYHRHKGYKNLYQYIENESSEIIADGFNDVSVTTYIAKLNKNPDIHYTKDEFEIENISDLKIKHYFYADTNRLPIDFESIDSGNHPDAWNERTFILDWRDICNGHLPYSKKTNSYMWNVEYSIDSSYIINNCNKKRAKEAGKYEVCFYAYTFKTQAEKDNITNYMYSEDGFRFTAMLCEAMNSDGSVNFERLMPKVDWSRPWSVEEILIEYGLTEIEIKEILNDLNKFDYMHE